MNNIINTQEPEHYDANMELGELPTISARPICLIPSQYFFVEFISFENEDDQHISDKEVYRFFELQLESFSPFPLEQLLWGYYTPPNAQQSILYACLKSRLVYEGYDELENYIWVLPHFVPQLALETIQQSELRDLSKLEALSTNEAEVHSIDLEKDFQISIARSTTNEEPNDSVTSISLELPVLWSADIRSEAFKDQEQKNRSRLAFVNKSLKFSLYFIVFVLLSELTLAGADIWLSRYASKIETQAPTVRIIEDQHTLINKLDQISKNEVSPIKLLEQANQVRTNISSNIIYDNVDINNENEVTIKGSAGSVNDLNRYVTQLNQSNNFKILEDPKYITRGGKTTFTLKMYFQSNASQF